MRPERSEFNSKIGVPNTTIGTSTDNIGYIPMQMNYIVVM